MDMNNPATTDDKQVDISNCRVRRNSSGTMECMVEELSCPWRINAGRKVVEQEIYPIVFCMHASADSISNSATPRSRRRT